METIYVERSNHLSHHGIEGQKWGVRRWQNADGSLTPEGRIHYGVGTSESPKGGYKNFFDKQRALRKDVNSYQRRSGKAGMTDIVKNFGEKGIAKGYKQSMADKRSWKEANREERRLIDEKYGKSYVKKNEVVSNGLKLAILGAGITALALSAVKTNVVGPADYMITDKGMSDVLLLTQNVQLPAVRR